MERMGAAYTGLLAERRGVRDDGEHAALGGEPVIGRVARAGFSDIWRFIRDEAGFSPEEAREFIATGMLINTIVGLRLTGDYGNEVSATEVLDACFPDAVAKVRTLLPQVDEPW